MTADAETRIRPGLLSITFRKLTVKRIIDLAVEAQLSAVEWGGDVHVPHGDLGTARAVRRMCGDHGLTISAYGSYYRAGGAPANPAIEAVLDTAAALGTTVVRVWAGDKGSAQSSDADRTAVATDLARCCGLAAAARGLTIATEFHGGTLTDEIDSTLDLLGAVPGLMTFWQPPVGMDPATALAGLRRVRSRLSNVHVFHWWPDGAHRLPLADGGDRWPAYLREAAEQSAADGVVRYASLEFVADDDPEQFRRDAATLVGWLADPVESHC
jgi:3-dehydroshikimate dehydratase